MKTYVVFLVLAPAICFSQVDNYARNSRILDSLELVYKKELEAHPASAVPHWNHAKALGSVNFRASSKAPQYFIKALQLDDSNPEIYYDFAQYLESAEDWEGAYATYAQGLKNAPGDNRFIKGMERIKALIEKEEKYWKLHKLPDYEPIKTEEKVSFKEMTDFDAIIKVTKEGDLAFSTLKEKFLNQNDLINLKETYYLMISVTDQDSYNPYNQKDEDKMTELTKSGDLDEAIRFGESILNTEITNMNILWELMYCYRAKEITDKAILYETRLKKLLMAMQYAGKGNCS
jgi:tetratricopeptide (TPR) repeat protein